MNVQTNIGREFLNLVSKHFPKKHRYNKIFNKKHRKSKLQLHRQPSNNY